MQVTRESGNLYRLARSGLVNCFLVKDGDGCVLVDTNVGGSSRAHSKGFAEIGMAYSKNFAHTRAF